MDSQNKRRMISEVSNDESKPLSAWERRKLYSKQMYNKYRNGRNLENKTSTVQKIDSGKQLERPPNITRVNSKGVKRKLSLVKDENIIKERNQSEKQHKIIKGRDSLFPKKNISPKRKCKSGFNGKENSESKKSRSFPVHRTSPRLHSVRIPVEKDTLPEPSPVPKLRRSASFTIDKGANETKPHINEGENTTEGNIGEIQNASLCKSNQDMKITAMVDSNVSVPETNISVENQVHTTTKTYSAIKNIKQDSKSQPTKKTPLKLNRRASLLVKKDKFVKPTTFSGKKVNRREQLMTWKQQQDNKPATISNRRMTCVPSILGSSRQFAGKQVAPKVNQLKNRRTLSSVDNLKEEKVTRMSKRSAAISSKPHEQRNSSRLSLYQRKKESALTLPINEKQLSHPSRKSCSWNALPKFTVAANVERSVAHRKTPVEARGCRKSMLKSGSNRKIGRSATKRKSIAIDQQLDNRTEKDFVLENQFNVIATDFGNNDLAEQLKYDSVGEEVTSEEKTDTADQLKYDSIVEEVTSEDKTDNNFIAETKEGTITEQPNNDLATNHTPHAVIKDLVLSRKKSVCFDIPLPRSTLGKALPKTPKRDFTLRERLQLWLDNKGHSISSFRHVKCFGLHLSNVKPKKNLQKSHDRTDMTPEPETAAVELGESPILRTRLSTEVDLCPTENSNFDVGEVLAELKMLLTHGHPTKDITEWLDELVKCLPAVEENPQYWICRSLVAELQSGVNGAIAVYHAALDKKVSNSQEENEDKVYTAEICKGLDSLLRRYTENFQKKLDQSRTPRSEGKSHEKIHSDTPREPLIDKKNIFNSTVIKYGLSYSTPGSYKSSVKAVVTPVRRSARLSCAALPTTEHTLLDSLTDLPQNIKKDILFRENDALVPN